MDRGPLELAVFKMISTVKLSPDVSVIAAELPAAGDVTEKSG